MIQRIGFHDGEYFKFIRLIYTGWWKKFEIARREEMIVCTTSVGFETMDGYRTNFHVGYYVASGNTN